jgi:ABC-type uncharacterized transport system permease subunit
LCWTSNHQNTYRNGPRAHFPFTKAIHNIDEAEAHQQYKHKRDKVTLADQSKPMLLCEDIAKQKVLLGSQLSDEQEKTLLKFLFNYKDAFA